MRSALLDPTPIRAQRRQARRIVQLAALLWLGVLGSFCLAAYRWLEEGVYLDQVLYPTAGAMVVNGPQGIPALAEQAFLTSCPDARHFYRASRPVFRVTFRDRNNFTVDVRFRWAFGGRWRLEVKNGGSDWWVSR